MILVMLEGTRVAPNTNVDRVVKSKNADLAGAVMHESDDVRLASVASAPHVMALKERAFKVDAEKAGFGLETADVEELLFNDCKYPSADPVLASLVDAALEPLFIKFRTPKTDHEVDNNVKRNPPRITLEILITSMEDPNGSANGRVTSDGTKKTGNHLANTAAPGLKRL